MLATHVWVVAGSFSVHKIHTSCPPNQCTILASSHEHTIISSMIFIMANWNPNDTLKRSSLLSFKLRNIWPLILASKQSNHDDLLLQYKHNV